MIWRAFLLHLFDFVDSLFLSSTCSLTKSHRRRLNSFFCKCLRSILTISPSQISRVSTNHILHRFKTANLSTTLLKRQLILFGKIARLDNDYPLRQCVCEPNTINVCSDGSRRRGRPRMTWDNETAQIILEMLPNMDNATRYSVIQNEKHYMKYVAEFLSMME